MGGWITQYRDMTLSAGLESLNFTFCSSAVVSRFWKAIEISTFCIHYLGEIRVEARPFLAVLK
jgi:hypothetical protein